MDATEVNLTSEQLEAAQRGTEAIKSGKKLFKIAGAAGTGKSTILRKIVDSIPGMAVCAFSGKAASVLRKKGMDGTTIHKRVYRWDKKRGRFIKHQGVPYSAFAIDEGSMVGDNLYRDVVSFGLPVLVTGDHCQLEPVSSRDVNLMKEPDVVLEKIHRQAHDNPIIDLATEIRTGGQWGYQDYDERALVLNRRDFDDDLGWPDVVLCGYNSTRVRVNKTIRHMRKFPDASLAEGERIICLQNDDKLQVFNGQTFDVTKIHRVYPDRILIDAVSDGGDQFSQLMVWRGAFNTKLDLKKAGHQRGERMVADYAYAMTVHKSQGSEWDRVVVIDEQCDAWCPKRWRYTAVTRAAKNLRFYI